MIHDAIRDIRSSIDNKLRVLYINHPDPGVYNKVPLVGHGYLGTIANMNDCAVKIIDSNFYLSRYTNNDILNLVNSIKPHYVGITLFTHTAIYAYRLLDLLRSQYRGGVYVAGGPHATICPEEVLQYGFDIACRGEGEQVSADLIKCLRGENEIGDIDGISYKENNKIVHKSPSVFIKDLDQLPEINYDLFDPLYFSSKNLSNEFGVFTSRGCPNKCTFCNSYGVFGTRYRYRSSESILHELELLHRKYQIKRINFLDDYYTLNHKRLQEVCEGILRRNLEIHWQAYSTARPIPKELLLLMKRSGCVQVSYGVENVYPPTIKKINKKVTVKQIEQTFSNHLETGIKFKANIMSGFPWESKKSLRSNIDFILAKKANRSNVRFNFPLLNPIPSTKIYNDYVKMYPRIEEMWLKIASNGATVSNLPEVERLKYNYFELDDETIKEIRFLYFVGNVVPYYSKDALGRGSFLKRFIKVYSFPVRKLYCNYRVMKSFYVFFDFLFPKLIDKSIH